MVGEISPGPTPDEKLQPINGGKRRENQSSPVMSPPRLSGPKWLALNTCAYEQHGMDSQVVLKVHLYRCVHSHHD